MCSHVHQWSEAVKKATAKFDRFARPQVSHEILDAYVTAVPCIVLWAAITRARLRSMPSSKITCSRGCPFGVFYCMHCCDVVYAKLPEELTISHRQPQALVRRKRKRVSALESWLATNDASQHVQVLSLDGNMASFPLPHVLVIGRHASALRGFVNLGNTCYLSAVLHALLCTPLLRNYFLADGHTARQCRRPHCLTCALDYLCTQVRACTHHQRLPFLLPHQVLHTPWQSAQSLAGYHQQDAHEWLLAILDDLHGAHGGPKPSRTHCPCVVHCIYSGLLRSDVTCAACNDVSTTLDPFLDHSLPLPLPPKPTSLSALFDAFTQPEPLAATCTTCGPTRATKRLSIHQAPPVICFHLKRFDGSTDRKLVSTVAYPIEVLDMAPYGHNASHPLLYDLVAVISHVGGDMHTGHYTACARDHRRHGWFQYDDTTVTPIDDASLCKQDANVMTHSVGNSDCCRYVLIYTQRQLVYQPLKDEATDASRALTPCP
ncbi:Aste57867_21522 [Aphanomyces stellatus]|uniref:ubiquitinyl hydrolase 1 n=1 Tax=Aphanomyces stellatus TaxID=120398 RepID=A0A485LJ08_9STRA|nr:hypothetical protein As57867_021453 [Aphanomyces stellatus]VFT98192.1 Aste57867_21522 [Aphanomyces stellatus]